MLSPQTGISPEPEVHVLDDMLAQHRLHGRTRLIRTGKPVMAFAATETAEAATADDDDPPPEKLSDLLKQSTKAPSSTAISAVPSSMSDADMQHLSDILLLNSYVSVASMRYLFKINPAGWDITDPAGAAAFTRAAANAKFKILTTGLGSFLSLNTSSARSFNESTTSADLHLSFLASLFGGFGFPKQTMDELDGVLTSVNKTLDDLKLSFSDQSSTLDHMVFFYYFDEVPGLPGVKMPKMRLFFLHIDQESWTASVGKSSVSHFEFHMNFDDNIFVMDPTQVANSRNDIQQLISTMTGQSFDAINDLLSPKVAHGDTNSATPSS